MTDLPSPAASRVRPPSWLDGRLVLGVLLVLVSVVAGARLVASADRSVRVWAAAGPLAAGTTLGGDDLRAVRVRLYEEPGRYLRADRPLAGRTLSRDVSAGELLPADALGADPAGRLVSLPVGRLHAPRDLRRGQRVDVYATVKPPGGAARTRLVLADAAVQGVRQTGGGLSGSGAELAVYVRVPPESAAAVVAAVQGGQLDVVGVVGPAGRSVSAVAGGPPTPGR